MRKLPQTSKVKLGEENIKLMKSHTEKIVTTNVCIAYKEVRD